MENTYKLNFNVSLGSLFGRVNKEVKGEARLKTFVDAGHLDGYNLCCLGAPTQFISLSSLILMMADCMTLCHIV